MKAMDLIEDRHRPGNLHIKLLVPTRRMLKYFGQMGAALRKSAGVDVGAKEVGRNQGVPT